MAAYRRVYDSRHLQADCQEPGSAPEPYARRSSMGYLYVFTAGCGSFAEMLTAVRLENSHSCPDSRQSEETANLYSTLSFPGDGLRRLCSADKDAVIKVKVKYTDIAVRSLTCHTATGTHSVTCHPTDRTYPPLPQPKLVLD